MSHAFGTKMDGHQGVSDGRQLLQRETKTVKKSGTCHTFLTLAVSRILLLCLRIFEGFISGSAPGGKLS